MVVALRRVLALIMINVFLVLSPAAYGQDRIPAFEYAGISPFTDIHILEKRFPNSKFSRSYVWLTREDSKKYLATIGFNTYPDGSKEVTFTFDRFLRINEKENIKDSPDSGLKANLPPCTTISSILEKRYGWVTDSQQIISDGENGMRYIWKKGKDEMRLFCASVFPVLDTSYASNLSIIHYAK